MRATRRSVLGNTDARVAVEAAVQMSRDRCLGFQGRFVGMSGFGEPGKIGDVYKMFEITTKAGLHAAHESRQAVYG
jgi:transketolase